MTAPVGILAAIDRELEAVLADFEAPSTERVFSRTFHRGVLHGRETVAVVAGIGKTAVAATTTLLVQHFGVDRIVLIGVAGQVSEGLAVGDVVVATHLMHHDLDASPIFPRYHIPSLGTSRLETDEALSSSAYDAACSFIATERRDGAKVARGLILSGDQFMSGPELADLRRRFPDALAVEMEGAAAAQVCIESGTPYAIVRVISDAGGADDFERFLRHESAAYARGIIGRLLPAMPGGLTEAGRESLVAGAFLAGERAAFNVPADIAYFNTASLAPQLHAVRAAGEAALDRRGRPWTISAEDWFVDVERLRSLFAEIVGGDAEGVAIVPATSYGFAVAARNLPLRPGERVLVLAEEYPSGIYAWRRATRRSAAELLTVTREPGQAWTQAVVDALDERVGIVSVPNVHWTDGASVDLPAIAARSREVGARLVIDGSQSVGAMPLDIEELQPDFLVTVGYKWLLGPFSVGYLYVSEEHRRGEPLEENWIVRAGSDDFARLIDYRDGYQPGARRFDVGQRTKFELMPMAIAALGQIVAWQVPRIADTLAARTAEIARGAADLGLQPPPDDQRGPHILGLRLPEVAHAKVLSALTDANCFAAMRGNSLRISPHLHTTDEDVGRLLGALATAL